MESDYHVINNCDYSNEENDQDQTFIKGQCRQIVFLSSSKPTPLLPQRSES